MTDHTPILKTNSYRRDIVTTTAEPTFRACANVRLVHGFTLVETAIVLVIVALLLGGLLAPLSSQMERADRKGTQATQQVIEDALIGFAMSAGRLPCPDTDGDGQEDPLGGVGGCTANEGALPAVTLGVIGDDAWHQPHLYLVTGSFADDTDGTGCGTATLAVSFELCSSGDINVADQSVGGTIVANNVPAAIVSSGKNWSEAPSVNEAENSDGDRLLVSRVYTSAAGQEFDDLVSWISPNILRSKMVQANRLP